jgi:DNA mismatch repair protein MutS
VAQLAGVPRPVIAEARRYLAQLEAHQAQAQPSDGARGQGELALGQAAAASGDGLALAELFRARLGQLDPDSLTPRAALELIYELRSHIAGGEG